MLSRSVRLVVPAFAFAIAASVAPPDDFNSLGELNGKAGWRISSKKGEEAALSPVVVSPGLNDSRCAILLSLGLSKNGASSEHLFPEISGKQIRVELKVRPFDDTRGLGFSVRGGTEATAYFRLNATKPGWVEHYGPTSTYKDVAPFRVAAENHIMIQLNTARQKLKAWVNGEGGAEWDFRSPTRVVDRVDLFMTHGRGREARVIVDSIIVRDDNGRTVFSEDFENTLPGCGSPRQ